MPCAGGVALVPPPAIRPFLEEPSLQGPPRYWRSGLLIKWSGIPLAVGFALFIPQYTGSRALPAAHGLLITLACGLMASNVLGWRR